MVCKLSLKIFAVDCIAYAKVFRFYRHEIHKALGFSCSAYAKVFHFYQD